MTTQTITFTQPIILQRTTFHDAEDFINELEGSHVRVGLIQPHELTPEILNHHIKIMNTPTSSLIDVTTIP